MVRPIVSILTVLSLATAARAQGLEEAARGGGLQLERAISAGLALPRAWTSRPMGVAPQGLSLPAALPGKDDFQRYLNDHAQLAPMEGVAGAGTPVAELDLAKLLNRQWKTPATFTMGGQTVYVGGAFDRQQNAFVGAFVDGWAEPKFFNIKGLLDKEGDLKVGSAAYSVTLSPNILKPMKSQIVFENRADEEDQSRISVKKLLDSLNAAGETVKLSDQSYQAFYYSDVKDGPSGPAVDPNSRTFALILTEGEDLHVFLIPAETVPSNQVAVFKMFKDKRVGLQAAGNSLKVFENP